MSSLSLSSFDNFLMFTISLSFSFFISLPQALLPGLPGPKKLKRPNLAISSFKKGQILKNEKRPNKGQISSQKLLK